MPLLLEVGDACAQQRDGFRCAPVCPGGWRPRTRSLRRRLALCAGGAWKRTKTTGATDGGARIRVREETHAKPSDCGAQEELGTRLHGLQITTTMKPGMHSQPKTPEQHNGEYMCPCHARVAGETNQNVTARPSNTIFCGLFRRPSMAGTRYITAVLRLAHLAMESSVAVRGRMPPWGWARTPSLVLNTTFPGCGHDFLAQLTIVGRLSRGQGRVEQAWAGCASQRIPAVTKTESNHWRLGQQAERLRLSAQFGLRLPTP